MIGEKIHLNSESFSELGVGDSHQGAPLLHPILRKVGRVTPVRAVLREFPSACRGLPTLPSRATVPPKKVKNNYLTFSVKATISTH